MHEDANVYVVDDDEAVLMSVKAILGQDGYRPSCFSSAEQFLEVASLDCPGCVVTDIQMPGMSGVELQRRLLAAQSVLSVVVVTGVADVPTTVALMENGAVTLLEKPYSHVDLLSAVSRGLIASHALRQHRLDEQFARQRLSSLTDEERQVMELMLTGNPNKSIAGQMELSMRTVDRRRRAVLEKMEVKSVPELAILLGRTGLSEPQTASATNVARI